MSTPRYFLPDFVEIQRQSFFNFLEKGIIEEFSKRNPITNLEKEIEIFFYPEYYKLIRPRYNIQKAVLNKKSYVSKLYIPVQFTDKKKKRICLKWVLICHLPLMTNRGHFLLNGSARVIVNQLVRSPGIYFRESLNEIYPDKWNPKPTTILRRFYADIICLKGTWLRLEIDKDNCIWAKMKKGPKIPILWLLLGMGFNEKIIFSSVLSPNKLLTSFQNEFEAVAKNPKKKIKYPYVSTPPQAWKQLAELSNLKKTKKGKNIFQLGRKWLFQKFMDPRTYDLGKHGRLSLNKKLGLTISYLQTTLTPQDLLTATNYLMKIEKGYFDTDDIDHLQNKRVRSSGELIQAQFALGLLRLERSIRLKFASSASPYQRFQKNSGVLTERIVSTEITHKNFTTLMYNPISRFTINSLVNARPVNGVFKEFFGTNPLSQFMDQINPLAEITHKRRLTSLGPGGVSRDTATLSVRGIHPSHYGRICPIETPEGKNTGLVNSITTYARVNFANGSIIESPFYRVYKGQVQKKEGFVYLSADQEEKINVATADLNFSKLGFLPNKSIPARFNQNFVKILRSEANYIGVSPVQMISVATSFIPFLEHDDANRALMGSNMQRQAVPLLRPQRPLVGTGLEARAVSDSGQAILAKDSGYITYVSASKIIVYQISKN